MLVLEDLHRADAATRALVTFLARISRDQRLAIIGTHQPDVVARDDSWTSDLEAILTGSRPERLALPPLDRDELAALIEGIEGERASASLLLLVAERSGGLPLVAEELLAARRELPTASLTGLVRRAGHRPAGDPLAGMPAGPAPPGAGRTSAHLGPARRGGRGVRGRHEPGARPGR